MQNSDANIKVTLTPRNQASALRSRQRLSDAKASVRRAGRVSRDAGQNRASTHVKRVLSGKVGKRPMNGFMGKSSRTPSQLKAAHRPKRNAIHTAWDYTAGLSWKEEKELKKALMASLQESKKPSKSTTKETGPETSQQDKKKAGRKPKDLKLEMPPSGNVSTQQQLAVASKTSKPGKSFGVHVRAQRKFAQGSRPCSPGCSPTKAKPLTNKVLPTKKAKTEDFLTFLCLRGTSALPPHLDFTNNFLDNDSLSSSFPNTPRNSQDGSRPSTPNNGNSGKGDEISRSASPDLEIMLDANDLGVQPLVSTSVRGVAMAKGSIEATTSTRVRASMSARYTASRCTTNANSLSRYDSNSSSSNTPQSVSPKPLPNVDARSERLAKRSRSKSQEDSSDTSSGKRYATRGKQQTVQEIIAAKEHRASMSPKRSLKSNMQIKKLKDALLPKQWPLQRSSILSKIVIKKVHPKKKKKKKISCEKKVEKESPPPSDKEKSSPYDFPEELETDPKKKKVPTATLR